MKMSLCFQDEREEKYSAGSCLWAQAEAQNGEGMGILICHIELAANPVGFIRVFQGHWVLNTTSYARVLYGSYLP